MPSQILLFKQSRSASTLLERVISKQKNVRLVRDPLSSSRWTQLQWLQSESYEKGMPEDARTYLDGEVRKGIRTWQQALEDAQTNGQTLMVNNATFFTAEPDKIVKYLELVNRKACPECENFTMLPESLVLHLDTLPLFTIRNPRLTAPSALPALAMMGIPHGGGRPNYLMVTCHIWNRVLYDFYVSHGIEPIVVDGDDFIAHEEYARFICSRLGLDPDQACLSWPSEGDRDQHHPMYYASQSTLLNSTGPIPALAIGNRKLYEEESKWEAEFGEDLSLVNEMIDLAMTNYKYLYEKRLKMER